jgi:hypothetical protein
VNRLVYELERGSVEWPAHVYHVDAAAFLGGRDGERDEAEGEDQEGATHES